MVKSNAYKNLFLLITLFNAPFLIMEQIDFRCLDRGIPPNNINCEFPLLSPFDVGDSPFPPHDDEEGECLSCNYTRDEEVEEKPQKRKKQTEKKE